MHLSLSTKVFKGNHLESETVGHFFAQFWLVVLF